MVDRILCPNCGTQIDVETRAVRYQTKEVAVLDVLKQNPRSELYECKDGGWAFTCGVGGRVSSELVQQLAGKGLIVRSYSDSTTFYRLPKMAQ